MTKLHLCRVTSTTEAVEPNPTALYLIRIQCEECDKGDKGKFPIEKATKLGISPNRGGSSKNQKSPKFQLGIVQN